MILRFYSNPPPFSRQKVGKKSGDIIATISYIGNTFLLQSTFNIVSLKDNLNISQYMNMSFKVYAVILQIRVTQNHHEIA